jgi:glycolate oxidase FAD binding subunit
LLGVKGVNGRAETFQSGGRVMKNVTGYDVARGLAGSWGTLAILTEVTFKVVPWPETAATIVYLGLPDNLAVELMCAAMALPVEVSGAVHLQAGVVSRLAHAGLKTMGKSVTALRLENFAAAVTGRKQRLKEALKVYGKAMELDHRDTLEFWGELRRLSVMPNRQTLLWRISTKPTTAPKLVAAIKRYMPAEAFYDWAGGLIWLEVPATADAGTAEIRRVAAIHGGHATLIRAEPSVRASVEVFQPLSPALERLTRQLKLAFDPAGILNPGRMYANV